MTCLEKIKKIIQTANTDSDLLPDDMLEAVMPAVLDNINEQSKSIGYKFTFNRPYEEYPEMVYIMLWCGVRHIVLAWLEENKPKAWFKHMYMSDDQRRNEFPEFYVYENGGGN